MKTDAAGIGRRGESELMRFIIVTPGVVDTFTSVGPPLSERIFFIVPIPVTVANVTIAIIYADCFIILPQEYPPWRIAFEIARGLFFSGFLIFFFQK